ncbi:MAG: DUF4142 domain-containing protein [Gemmatimonadota bacterium]
MRPGRMAFAILLLACGPDGDRNGAARNDTTVRLAPVAENPPADPEIAHILQTSNAIALRRATLAQKNPHDAAVRSLADSISAQHSALNTNTIRLLHAINLVPVNNQHSRIMDSDADAAQRELGAQSGREFDRTYVDHVVTFHQRMLDLLDDVLLPTARNPQLRDELQRSRALIARHLERARELQQSYVDTATP